MSVYNIGADPSRPWPLIKRQFDDMKQRLTQLERADPAIKARVIPRVKAAEAEIVDHDRRIHETYQYVDKTAAAARAAQATADKAIKDADIAYWYADGATAAARAAQATADQARRDASVAYNYVDGVAREARAAQATANKAVNDASAAWNYAAGAANAASAAQASASDAWNHANNAHHRADILAAQIGALSERIARLEHAIGH